MPSKYSVLHRAPVQQLKQAQVLNAIQDQLVQSVPTKRLHSHHVTRTISVCLSRLELQDYFLSFVNKQRGTVAENGSSHQCRKECVQLAQIIVLLVLGRTFSESHTVLHTEILITFQNNFIER